MVDLACQKPKDLDYASELWTYRSLAKHIREHALEAGFPELKRAGKGLIHLILDRHDLRPHKIRYYLEQRDPNFELKKAQILVVYKEVALLNESKHPESRQMTTLCVDENPTFKPWGLCVRIILPSPENSASGVAMLNTSDWELCRYWRESICIPEKYSASFENVIAVGSSSNCSS